MDAAFSAMTPEDTAVVAQIKAEGIAVLDLLTPAELEAARADMDCMYSDEYQWRDEEHAGERQLFDPLPETVGAYPGIERAFTHPRITKILREVMGEPPAQLPFLQAMRTDRYLAGHQGVAPHHDGGSMRAVAYEKMATMIFLDDIDEGSGALEYAPESHLRQLLPPDGSQPTDPPLPGGRCAEIDNAYKSGRFKPISLTAGSVVFRECSPPRDVPGPAQGLLATKAAFLSLAAYTPRCPFTALH